MRSFLRGLLHLFISTSVTAAAVHAQSGAPLTSGNVLVPAATAGVLAVVHAAWPSILDNK